MFKNKLLTTVLTLAVALTFIVPAAMAAEVVQGKCVFIESGPELAFTGCNRGNSSSGIKVCKRKIGTGAVQLGKPAYKISSFAPY